VQAESREQSLAPSLAGVTHSRFDTTGRIDHGQFSGQRWQWKEISLLQR